jgi:hypothetical protein
MRQVISGLVAAAAVMVVGAAPATACGFGGCSPCGGYVSPCAAPIVQSYNYGGCNTGCGGGYGARADVSSQYYYVNQGPTYSGPGAWAPARVYREGAVWGYRHHHAYVSAPYHNGRRVLRRYY